MDLGKILQPAILLNRMKCSTPKQVVQPDGNNSLYTLLLNKCTLISFSSPSDPGLLTPTPDHVKFVI